MLLACVHQAPDWKRRYGFPLDVELISNVTSSASDWRSVIVDFPELLTLVLILTPTDGATAVLGFPVGKDWKLEQENSLRFANGWDEVFPDLSQGPSADEWREAWRTWGRSGHARRKMISKR